MGYKCGINEYRVGVGGFKCYLEVWDYLIVESSYYGMQRGLRYIMK